MNRPEFDKMLAEGCPSCQSDETHETVVSVNNLDNVPAVICDACGHVEVKPVEKLPNPTIVSVYTPMGWDHEGG